MSHCISNSSVCDGWNDCSDGTDEAGCGKYQLHYCTVDLTATSTIHCSVFSTCTAIAFKSYILPTF